GVTISGVVSAPESRSIEDAAVKIGDPFTFNAYEARVDAKGAYRLNHVPPGEIHLTAEGKDGGRARAVFNGAPDETIIWNPILSDGLVIEGKVVDSEGRPRLGQVHCERDGQQFWVGQMWTDSNGRFRFTNVDDAPHRVVFEFHGMAPGTALVSAS